MQVFFSLCLHYYNYGLRISTVKMTLPDVSLVSYRKNEPNHVLSTNSIHRRSYWLSVGHKLLSADADNVALILEFKLIQIDEILAPASVIVNV
jgi:hypothetical protein